MLEVEENSLGKITVQLILGDQQIVIIKEILTPFSLRNHKQ